MQRSWCQQERLGGKLTRGDPDRIRTGDLCLDNCSGRPADYGPIKGTVRRTTRRSVLCGEAQERQRSFLVAYSCSDRPEV